MAVTLTQPDATKAAVLTDTPDMIHMSVPIEKAEDTPTINPVDGTPDIVIAGKCTDGTLDSDLQVVDPDASLRWIKTWYDSKANVRLGHDPKRPVGRGIEVDGHYVKALIAEPTAKHLIRSKVLNDFSIGIMNPDIRVGDPRFKHLDPMGKATGGVITDRADGMTALGEISVVDRGANFGASFSLVKAAADGTPEWVGKLTAPDDLLAKVGAPVATKAVKTHTVELPSDVRVTFSPKDLAKLTTFRQRLVDGQDKTATPAVAKNGSMPGDAAMLASEPRSDQEDDSAEDTDVPKAIKAAEAAVYKRDIDTATRRRLASEGKALPNLSYPIDNTEDLGNAARLARSGHGDVKAAKKLIARRAKELGVPNPLKGGKEKVATAPDVAKKKKVMCGGCGARQNAKHQHCSECGQGMAGAMPVEKNHAFTCLGCGQDLDKGEPHCPGCGKENPGYLPEADHQIPANQDKAAKAKVKAKKKAKGKKNPFGGKQSPPFGKDKDGDDDGDDDARKAARVIKGRKGGKGKGRTPGHNAVGEGDIKPAARHREPDGAPMEALEADAGMSDGDNEKPTHTEQLVGTAKSADPEMAAALTLKALGVPADLGALHALTCPAYDPADVAKAFPHDSFAGIDLSQWQLADLDKAASGPISEALASLALGRHAAALKGTDPYLLQDLRAEAHKMFTDANPGPSSFPTPGTLSAGRFNRPLITAGHQAASPDHDAPNHVALPEVGGISAGDFTRGYLTAGHAADAPENTHSGGPVSPAEPTGVPSSAPARGYYTNSARDSARHAMEAMHDHISRMFPDVCPMTGAEDIARHPVPTPQGVPETAPAPGGKKKKNKAAAKAAKAKARKAAARKRARERKLTAQVMKGRITVEQARVKLGLKPFDDPKIPVAELTKAAVAAPEAAPAAPAVDAKAIAKAVKAAVRPLNRKIAGQDKDLRKLRKETERIAAQPDTTGAPFRGSALTKQASAPPAGAPTATGLADQAQVTKLALLRQEWLNSSDPGAREAAYTELSKLLGVSTS